MESLIQNGIIVSIVKGNFNNTEQRQTFRHILLELYDLDMIEFNGISKPGKHRLP